jgi:putative ABC transport system substrate-binding protein
MTRVSTVGLLALALLAAPLVGEAQPVGKVSRIGILGQTAADPSEARLWQVFRLALREYGWIEGENLRIESRWGEDNTARLPALAAEVVRLKVDLIVTRGSIYVQGAQQTTSSSLQLQPVVARSGAELEDAFAAMARAHAQAVLVLGFGPYIAARQRLVALALRYRLPRWFGTRERAEAGGLMSYGPSLPDLYRRAAIYVDKILRGARPADLPVEQPTKFELVLNLKTAKALGLTIPPSVLARADKIIE